MSLAVLGICMCWGATSADEGMLRLTAIKEEIEGDPPLEAAVLRALGAFHAVRGQVDEGRRLVERSRAILEELGFRWALAAIPFVSGEIERLAGDLDAAESELRRGVELWDEMGELGAQHTMLGVLADVLYEQGRYTEAEDAAGRVLAMEMHDLEQQTYGGVVRSKTLARRGELEEAERVARETVVLTDATDGYRLRTRALLALAEVLELAGRTSEAAQRTREALRRFETKGDVISGQRTRERLTRLEAMVSEGPAGADPSHR
jgi:tetratricopeptide (TPR) repeat protein